MYFSEGIDLTMPPGLPIDIESCEREDTRSHRRGILGAWENIKDRLQAYNNRILNARKDRQSLYKNAVDPNIKQMEDYPAGYPRLAAFMSSVKELSQFRRFSTLRVRVLLMLQYDIMLLEHQLGELDDALPTLRSIRRDDAAVGRSIETNIEPRIPTVFGRSDHDALSNGVTQQPRPDPEAMRRIPADTYFEGTVEAPQGNNAGKMSSRRRLLYQIKKKLDEYDDVLMHAREVSSFQIPSHSNYAELRTHLYNTKPIVDPEEQWTRQKNDLLSFHKEPQPSSPVESWLELALVRMRVPFIQNLFRASEDRHKASSLPTYFFSLSRISICVVPVITLVMFMVPVIAMYEVTLGGTRAGAYGAIGILGASTVIFTIVMTLTTTARRHELFAAVAAYVAVLVVFLGNVSGNGNGGQKS